MSEMMKKRLFLRTALKSTLAKSKPSFELQVLNNDNNGHLRIPLSEDQLLRLLFGGGQTVEVEVELDTAPREVEVPADLATALERQATAKAAFEKLSYSNQNRIVLSVLGAKTEETRQRRIEKAVTELSGAG